MNTQEEIEKIKGKIEKLLKLKEGAEKIGSLEEAANAAAKISDMLIKYNLEMSQINLNKDENNIEHNKYDLSDLGWTKVGGSWIQKLYHVIATHNLCYVVISSGWVNDKKVDKYIYLFGDKLNIESVNYICLQLIERIKDMSNQAFKLYTTMGGREKRNAFKRGYFIGAVNGISTKLRLEAIIREKENSNITAMVVTNSAKIQEVVKDIFPRVGKAKQRKLSAESGKELGFRDGRNMDIRKGLNNGDNKALNNRLIG